MKRACLLAILTFASGLADEAIRMTPGEASARRGSDFAPFHLGRLAVVSGVVSSPPIHVNAGGYSHVGIQNGGEGLVIEGSPETSLDHLLPGQHIQVEGRISARGGLPVLLPSRIQVLGSGDPPTPIPTVMRDLQSFALLGQYVTIDAVVKDFGENSGGMYIELGPDDDPVRVFAPFSSRRGRRAFPNMRVGDKIRASGIASQYCPVPPHNRRFQLMVGDPSAVVRIQRGWLLPPWVLASLAGSGLLITLFLWTRERRHRRQREMLRSVYELGEEILSSSNVAEVSRIIAGALPRVFGVTEVLLFLYNRNGKTLEQVTGIAVAPEPPIPLSAPRKGLPSAVVSCFRNRTLLAIPDAARSPFASPDKHCATAPHSLLLIPMFAQGEASGVFVLAQNKGTRTFSELEKLVAQHLGNQIGVAVRLMEQRSIREQLFRTEKVAAVGRLITGVVNELQGPIAGVVNLAEQGLADGALGREMRTLREIYSEAGRASAIVNRLVSFDRSEHAEASPTDLNRLLRSLMEFRELEWKARGIQIRNFLREGPLFVLGSRGQLEQVFLSLLVFAEQSLAEATDKVIAIGSNLLARRILVEISFTRGLAEDRDPLTAGSSGDSAALDLSVCRSIIFGHEGEIRLTRTRAAESRFEIELPWTPMDAEAGSEQPRQIREPGRQLTVLLMEPDEIVRHQLVKLLGARSYRVVPVGSADEGLDLAQRLRFDVAFASPRLPGLNWIELLQKASAKVGAFVLLADSFESRPMASANGQRYFILPKPIEESRLDYILDHLLDQPALPQTAPTHA